MNFFEENEPNWNKGQVERSREREKKEESKTRHVQNKIDELFSKLPSKEREKIEMEEVIERRLELQKVKKEL